MRERAYLGWEEVKEAIIKCHGDELKARGYNPETMYLFASPADNRVVWLEKM